MTIRCIAAGTLGLLLTAVLAASQAPQNPIRPVTSGQTTTVLVGCLYREIQVSGKPGDYDDFILADATTPQTGPSRPEATVGATGTSGIVPTTGDMYEVKKIRDFRLDVFVGLRVELTGTIHPKDSQGSAQADLPHFEAKTIRAVYGNCPPTPAPRK
jgi:hypothetical protein